MFLEIAALVSPALCSQLRQALLDQPFVDGRASAGIAAVGAKHNRELPQARQIAPQLVDQLTAALANNQRLGAWALPRRLTPLMFSRYDASMSYGDHVDNGLTIIGNTILRTDLAVTIFLAPPDEYDGGELVIDSQGVARRVKLPMGDAVVYPAGTVHRVEAVTRGTRFVAIGWIESLVRDAGQREILHDLLLSVHAAPPEQRLRLDKCRANLLRMWVGR